MAEKRLNLGPIGPDINLDEEEVYLSNGTRLTEAEAEAISERVLAEVARRQGRPSITGEGVRTPSLTVRLPPQTRAALESIADAQGRRLADVSRDALDEYIERHAS